MPQCKIYDGARRLTLPYRSPFDWTAMLAFFAHRATPGVEMVSGELYRRTVCLEGQHGVLEIGPGGRSDCLALTLHAVRAASSAGIVQRMRALFDLDAPVGEIAEVLRRDSILSEHIRRHPGVRVPGAWDGFELTVRAILGQQVSVKAATTLAGRIAVRYGEPLRIAGGSEPLSRIFPTAERLRRAKLSGLGLVRSRAETIRRVAIAVAAGDLSFDAAQDSRRLCAALCEIRGIGDWTAQYVSMRVLKDPDAFPSTDLGLLKALMHPERTTPAVMRRRAEAWRPWRAYAAMLMWGSLTASGG